MSVIGLQPINMKQNWIKWDTITDTQEDCAAQIIKWNISVGGLATPVWPQITLVHLGSPCTAPTAPVSGSTAVSSNQITSGVCFNISFSASCTLCCFRPVRLAINYLCFSKFLVIRFYIKSLPSKNKEGIFLTVEIYFMTLRYGTNMENTGSLFKNSL